MQNTELPPRVREAIIEQLLKREIKLSLTGKPKFDQWRRWQCYQKLAADIRVEPEELWLWDHVYSANSLKDRLGVIQWGGN